MNNFRILSLQLANYKGCSYKLNLMGVKAPTTVLIGENGCGKSSIFEALLIIFGSFETPSIYLNNPFEYSLIYQYGECRYRIEAKEDSVIVIDEYVEQFDIYRNYLSGKLDNIRKKVIDYKILPQKVMTFYAGENDRLSTIHSKIMKGYRNNFTRKAKTLGKETKDFDEALPWRTFVHFDNDLIPICLAIGMQNATISKEIVKFCSIEKLHSISFSAKKSMSAQMRVTVKDEKGISDFVKSIDSEIAEGINVILKPKAQEKDNSYDFSITLSLDEKKYSPTRLLDFWERVSTAFQGDFETKYLWNDCVLDDKCLSQGQRQWVRILCMMLLSGEDGTLCLMDEPDAFMNPRWKYEFNEVISRIRENNDSYNLLVVSHDPLIVNGLKKENIRICKKEQNEVIMTAPAQDMEGLGIDGILRSECYGLTTTYDSNTARKYRRRMELYTKLVTTGELAGKEKEELQCLTREIGSMPCTYSSIDYLYSDFLKEYMESEFYYVDYATPAKVLERREFIRYTIEKLYGRMQ